MSDPREFGDALRAVRAASTSRPWLNRLAELLSVVSLMTWSAAVLLVMRAAVFDAPVVALDAIWLLAASAFLSTVSLLFAMVLDRKTIEEAGAALRPATTVDTDRALD
jgi:predicted ferric reductase